MGLLDALIYGLRDVFDGSDNQLPRRSRIKFTGTVTDDPANDRIVVTATGGGGTFTPPTGTGFAHVTGGVLDIASKKVDLSTVVDVTNTLGVGNGGTGLAAVGTSGNVLTSNGTSWTSAAPAGQAVGTAGQIQATNGTAGFTAPGPYAGSITGANYLSTIAGTPDVAGVRIDNNTTFSGRNFAGTADIIACYIDSANQVRLGSAFDATQGGMTFGVRSGASLKYAFNFGSGTTAYLSETEFAVAVPRHGYTSPYASEGQSTIAITTTTYTLTAGDYSQRILKFTGTFVGTSTVTFPLPASALNSYGKSIRNTSTSTLVLTNGGTTCTVAAGGAAEVMVTPDGIFAGGSGSGGGSSAGSSGQAQATDGAGGFTAPGPYLGAAYVSIISGTPTSSGYRMGNTHVLSGRNAAGTADLKLCYTDASNNVIVGENSANQAQTLIYAPSQIYLSTTGGNTLGVSSTVITTLVPKVSQTAVSATDVITDTAQLTTTTATATDIYTFTIPNNALTTVDVRITACQSTSGAGDVWRGRITFLNAAGTVTVISAATMTKDGSTAWVATMSNSTTTAKVTVTGAASTTIMWGLAINYQVTRQS